MFDKKVYIRRRSGLVRALENVAPQGERGIVAFMGNAEAPAQYKDNCYKFRQDSSWLYYFGIDSPRFAAVIDLDSGTEAVYADDFGIDDIIWTGPMPSVQSVAESVGVDNSAPYDVFCSTVRRALALGRPVRTLPPSRYYNTMLLKSLGIEKADTALIKAVIAMRLVKDADEIALLDTAATLGQKMHTIARKGIRVGRIEQEIVGEMEGMALGFGWGTSFTTILTQHGEIFHNHSHDCIIAPDKLMVIDAGFESNEHYASDFTRTYPTGGRFTSKQKDIYNIVCDCNELAFSLAAPGVAYRDVHLAVSARMLESLGALGLVRGAVDDMVAEGVAGLFMPHGLGHNMGLDVHDMEDLGEDLVGYDDDQKRSDQLGLRSLRMARRLVPGNVVTDEPGIYFIPALIEKWKKEGRAKDFVNYEVLKGYYDFGGIRLEDDVLITEDGARRLGADRLPITVEDVETAMENDKNS